MGGADLLNFIRMLLVGMGFFFVIKIFCSLFQNEALEEHITDLMIEIPHNQKHYSSYIQLQKSLMIMKMVSRKSSVIKFAGLFDISVEIYGKLLNISYSVVTFLLNVDH